MELLAAGKFRRLWVPGAEERDMRALLHHRHFLMAMGTRTKNGLTALALGRVKRFANGRKVASFLDLIRGEIKGLPLPKSWCWCSSL
jgi:hypothetical protein